MAFIIRKEGKALKIYDPDAIRIYSPPAAWPVLDNSFAYEYTCTIGGHAWMLALVLPRLDHVERFVCAAQEGSNN